MNHSRTIRFKRLCAALLVLLLPLLSACASSPQKTKIRVLIVSKFEIDSISGDFPGEAQLFYEHYCPGCEEAPIEHMPADAHFYADRESGVALLVTGAGKTPAGLSLMAVLSSDRYDWSETYIVSVGCAGGSAAQTTLGDIVLVTAACDYDLGHHVDAHEKKKSGSQVMWFPDQSYNYYEFKRMDPALCDRVYDLIKDCPLRTTEKAKAVMLENFPARTEEEVLPAVRKGTALTGDNYWKGIYGHVTANFIADYYECTDPYMVTEMEEIAIANTADIFGLLDRLISLRVVVNMDLFLNGDTPESIWGEYTSFSQKVENDNSETLDVFEPSMHNLFDASAIVIDAILSGDLK